MRLSKLAKSTISLCLVAACMFAFPATGFAKGPADGAKTYSKYKEIATISKDNTKSYFTIPKDGKYRFAESVVWMGNNTFAATLMRGDPKNDNHLSVIVKYKNKKRTARRQSDASYHANGICYNVKEKKLYVAKAKIGGGSTKKFTTFKSDTLSPLKTRTNSFSATNIGYDNATCRYVVNGDKLYIYNSSFKLIKKVKKKIKSREKIQDVSCFNGVAFSVENKGKKSFIDMYRLSDGAYLGTLKVKYIEIEGVCVDDTGHLILMNVYRQMYRTNRTVNSYIGIPNKDGSIK